MVRYRRLVQNVFEEGLVDVRSVRVAMLFTKRLVDKDPERTTEYWSIFYDVFMTVSHPVRLFESHKKSKNRRASE